MCPYLGPEGAVLADKAEEPKTEDCMEIPALECFTDVAVRSQAAARISRPMRISRQIVDCYTGSDGAIS